MPKRCFRTMAPACTRPELWKAERIFFYDKKGYGLISDTARYLHWRFCSTRPCAVRLHRPHDELLQEISAGYEAPINLVYSARNVALCGESRCTPPAEGQAVRV